MRADCAAVVVYSKRQIADEVRDTVEHARQTAEEKTIE